MTISSSPKKRLDSQFKRLGKRHKFWDQYSAKIDEQLENGITEEADSSLAIVGSILPIAGKTCFMSH